jgi:hypothetical protein
VGYIPDAAAPKGPQAYCEQFGQFPDMPDVGKWHVEGSCNPKPVWKDATFDVKLMYKGKNLFDRLEARGVPGESGWQVPSRSIDGKACGNIRTGDRTGITATDECEFCSLFLKESIVTCGSSYWV